MIVDIRPTDILFFRDSFNFDAGDFSRASSIFPPYPPTIYGAVRSLLSVQFGKKYNYNLFEIEKAPLGLGGSIDECELKINGYLLKSDSNYYLPVPSTLGKHKSKEKYKFFKPENDGKNKQIPVIFDKDYDSVNGYLDSFNTISILTNLPDIKITNQDKIYRSFEKVGIAIDKKKGTAEEHKIYKYLNYELNYGNFFRIFINPTKNLKKEISMIEKKGTTKFGGEMRPAYYEIIDQQVVFLEDEDIKKIAEIIAKNRRFFLWLVTPGIFRNGSIPDFCNKESKKAEIIIDNISINLTLISWQLDKPIHIGGFDIKERIPKTMYKAVPAGAVYFFEIEAPKNIDLELSKNIIKYFLMKPLKSHIKNAEKQGFACALIGGY